MNTPSINYKKINIAIKIAAILLTLKYFQMLVTNFAYLFGNPYEQLFWKSGITFFLEASVANTGLWLSISIYGKKYKILTIIFLFISLGIALCTNNWIIAPIIIIIHISAMYLLFEER